MHLTNYSVNKHSDSFDDDESTGKGSKRQVEYAHVRNPSIC